MQAIWRGAISFGLITIPVRLYSATSEKTPSFRLLHATDNGKVRYNRTCAECGAENLSQDDMVRAYEYEKGNYVVFTDEELEAIQTETSHTVEVVNFVPSEQIDPIFYQRSYYLAPEEVGTKAYALLRRALLDSGRVAVARVAIRQKERLATLRVRDQAIILETMYWPDEIREAEFPELTEDVDLSDRELNMAQTLVENLTEDFQPDEFHDTYREALVEAVEEKIAGKEIVAPAAGEEEPQVVDLMEALERSVDEAKRRSKRDEAKQRSGKKASGE